MPKGYKRAPSSLKVKRAKHMDTDDKGNRMSSRRMTGMMIRMPKGRKMR